MTRSYSTNFRIPLEPSRPPGLLTIGVHYLLVAGLSLVLLLLWPFRLVLTWLAEVCIRLSDSTSDALSDRLRR